MRKYLCHVRPVLLGVYNKILGEEKKEIGNWIIAIFQLDKWLLSSLYILHHVFLVIIIEQQICQNLVLSF